MAKTEDDETLLKDGEKVRVSLLFMDAKTVLDDGLTGGMHRPGYRYIATDSCCCEPYSRGARCLREGFVQPLVQRCKGKRSMHRSRRYPRQTAISRGQAGVYTSVSRQDIGRLD